MLIHVEFSDEIVKIIKSSWYYSPSRSFTMDELLDISEFVHFYENKPHLNFIQNEKNILYGFCYAKSSYKEYWMFLDENYRFYDVSLPEITRENLGDIYDTVKKILPSIYNN